MARRPLTVRDAFPGDYGDLLRLWAEIEIPGVPVANEADARFAITRIIEAADERLLVGELDGRVVAAVHLRRRPVTPLHAECLVATSFLLVLPEFRRRGFARCLLDAAVTWAEEERVGTMTASAIAMSRDNNRFLARMGFATSVIQRLAPTYAVRAKLSPHSVTGTSLGQVLAQRRAMRSRTAGAAR